MCEPTTIAIAAGGLIAGMAASSALSPKIPNIEPTTPQAPPAPQQVAGAQSPRKPKTPGGSAGIAAGPSASPGSTMLTGPQGIDPSMLQLGRRTLLGM